MLGARQRAFLSAAIRHVSDASHMVRRDDASDPPRNEPSCYSPDQAWHLAGFGPECAWKACIGEDLFHKVLGHELTPPSWFWEWSMAIDRLGRRYWTPPGPGSPLRRWKPAHRYDATGSHTRRAPALVEEASAVVVEVLLALWADGRVELQRGGDRDDGRLVW